jgi:hypothetical protein
MRERKFKTYKVDKPIEIADPKEGTNIIPFRPKRADDMAKRENGRPKGSGSPREEICIYCSNKKFDVCTPCGQEGKYRHLVPTMLENWENFDHLVMKNLVDWDAPSRLAALYLMAYYRKA